MAQQERQPEQQTRVETVVKRAPAQEAAPTDVVTADAPPSDSRGPGGPGDPPPPRVERLYKVWLIADAARKADEAARRARARRRHTSGLLGGLIVLAIAAAAVGIVADSAAFWTAAGAVFLGALSVVIAFAARELGVFSESAELITRLLARAGPLGDATSKRDIDALESTDPMLPRTELARELFELGEELLDETMTRELFEVENHSEGAEAAAYRNAAYLSFKRAADAGDARAACWAGRMKFELGAASEAEELYLSAQNPLGSYWLGELHARELVQERSSEWWLSHARNGYLVAAYVLGRLHQREDSFNPHMSEELLRAPVEI